MANRFSWIAPPPFRKSQILPGLVCYMGLAHNEISKSQSGPQDELRLSMVDLEGLLLKSFDFVLALQNSSLKN